MPFPTDAPRPLSIQRRVEDLEKLVGKMGPSGEEVRALLHDLESSVKVEMANGLRGALEKVASVVPFQLRVGRELLKAKKGKQALYVVEFETSMPDDLYHLDLTVLRHKAGEERRGVAVPSIRVIKLAKESFTIQLDESEVLQKGETLTLSYSAISPSA